LGPHDVTRIHSRRQLLKGLILVGAAEVLARRVHAAGCTADPEETTGPFPADGTNATAGGVANVLTLPGIVRSDIRRSFGSSSALAEGVPLRLSITLLHANATCEALSDYSIYLWQCDREGGYSLYSRNIQNENYLRGVQITDQHGQATFQTIFPACYLGRYPHVHVEIYRNRSFAAHNGSPILTSQFAMPRNICEAVYAKASGYGASLVHLTEGTPSADYVFERSTAQQLAAQTPVLSGGVEAGYTGSITVGIPAH
jgi:protocatechuate 3,4-dioxygenase beta subunit